MATTDIHAITGTVGQAIDYVVSDKVEAIKKDDIADSIAYAMNDKTGEVVYLTLTNTHNCVNQQDPVKDFYFQMKRYGEDEILHGNSRTIDGKPILAWHLIQSFEGQVDPTLANEIGMKLTRELFPNFPVVVSTHTNTENTHNHIMICAWDLDGKKYSDDKTSYRAIRTTSDRLCDEYGLSVIEHTRKQKLIQWRDEDGKLHFYEPTDRKNEMIRKRQAGELTTDDVGSYRNTVPYEVATEKKLSNVETVKRAIDSLLPYATSYEHLLMMMRERGFAVKDKKKNGDWLAHVSFTAPTAERGVRDSSISRDGYYTRENLTALIEAQNAERERSQREKQEEEKSGSTFIAVPFFAEYVYGKIDVQSINETYRAERKNDGTMEYVRRGEAERDVIRDIKASDKILTSVFDTSGLQRMVERQREEMKQGRPPKTSNETLIRQIHEGLDNLRFMEEKKIFSYAQINERVKGMWEQYNSCLDKIVYAESMIDRLEKAALLPKALEQVSARIEKGRDNPQYMMEQYHKDVKLAQSYMDNMKKYGVSDADSVQKLQDTIAKYKAQISKLDGALVAYSKELSAYDRCVRVLSRIDEKSGTAFKGQLQEYRTIVRNAEQEARTASEKRSSKKSTHDNR